MQPVQAFLKRYALSNPIHVTQRWSLLGDFMRYAADDEERSLRRRAMRWTHGYLCLMNQIINALLKKVNVALGAGLPAKAATTR